MNGWIANDVNNDSGVLDVGYDHAKHTLSLNVIATLLGILGYEWDYGEGCSHSLHH